MYFMGVKRRDFLKIAAGTAATAFARNSLNVRLGMQTNAWPVDRNNFDSLLAVLAGIKAFGYEGFETGFANVQGQFDQPTPAKAKLSSSGLRFFGVHIFLNEYDRDTNIAPSDLYDRVAAGVARLGAERLILSGTPPADEAGLRRKTAALNRAGIVASRAGIKLSYHNHWMEFERQGHEYDFLLKETDPANVSFVMDAGHAYHAGADVPAFVRSHHRRLAGIHLRDFQRPGDFQNDLQVPLGSGNFPLAALVGVIRETGWTGWLINEEERLGSKPGDAAVRPAHDTLFRAVGESK